MATVNSIMRTAGHPTEERGGVSRAHYHLKEHTLKQLAENRADFDGVKRVFYSTIEKF